MSGIERSSHALTCPHCGSPYQLNQSTTWNNTEWKLTTQFGTVVFKSKLQSEVFDLLWRKNGIQGLTKERILDIIYIDDINGGPADTTMRNVLQGLRKQLVNVGIIIDSGNSRGLNGYSLVFMTPEQAAKQWPNVKKRNRLFKK